MKPTYLFILVFSFTLFSSFSSENNSEILPKKEVCKPKINSQKKENTIQFKTQKLNFKEKIALKLIENKIKKEYSNTNFIKMNDTVFILLKIVFSCLVLTSVILSVVSFFSGNILVGILLLLIAALLGLYLLGLALGNNEGHVMLKNSDSTLN